VLVVRNGRALSEDELIGFARCFGAERGRERNEIEAHFAPFFVSSL
jgi:hypothetical protein